MTDSLTLTPQQVADELGISLRHAQQLIADGVLPSVRISERVTRVYRKRLVEWIEAQEKAAS